LYIVLAVGSYINILTFCFGTIDARAATRWRFYRSVGDLLVEYIFIFLVSERYIQEGMYNCNEHA